MAEGSSGVGVGGYPTGDVMDFVEERAGSVILKFDDPLVEEFDTAYNPP
jgi:hypothetical protein